MDELDSKVPVEEEWPPEGCILMYITDSTLQRWGMKTGEMIADMIDYKKIPRAVIEDEIERMAVSCDFYEWRSQLKEYEGDEILLVRGPEDQYEINYIWPNTADAYDRYINILEPPEEEETKDEAELLEEKVPEYVDEPLIAKQWVDTYDVEMEVRGMKTVDSRLPKGFFITQQRKLFGRDCEFNVDDPKDITKSEYKRQTFLNYGLQRIEQDKGFQAASGSSSVDCQTHWANKINKITQYYPVDLPEAEREKVFNSDEMKKFLQKVEGRTKRVLQSNEVLDLWKNEFKEFDDDDVIGNRAENILKELHSFTDLTYAKGRNITGICWQPNKQGVVAFACSNNLTFDQWVEVSGKVLTSSILIWNFQDLLHPQLILDVPGDLTCFEMNKDNPNLIAAGLATGQVILWDLTQAKAKLSHNKPRKVRRDKKSSSDENKASERSTHAIPPIKPQVISFIDRSHGRAVTDIKWLPLDKEVNRKGEPRQTGVRFSHQFITVAGDGHLLFWDLRTRGERSPGQAQVDDSKQSRWVPLHQTVLAKPESKDDVVFVTRLSFGEGTNLVCVTEDGEVCQVDWNAKIVGDSPRPEYVVKILPSHFHACTAVQRSPHFEDMYLTVGDWTFAIWTMGMDTPIFHSPCATDYLTCACWSPTRPGIIITARADGVIDIWDLLDECHKPSLTFPVTGGSESISSMEFWCPKSKTNSTQYLGVGDVGGKLHVLEIPRALKRKLMGEEQLMRKFYDREIQRVEYSKERASVRLQQAKQNAARAPPPGVEDGEEKSDEAQAAAQKEAEAMAALAQAEAEATKEKKAEEEFQRMLRDFKRDLEVDDE